VLTGTSILSLGSKRIYQRWPPPATILNPFQDHSPGRARQDLCRNQKAMICPISKRFLRHPSLNSPPSSRLVSPACRAYPADSDKAYIRRSMLANTVRGDVAQDRDVAPSSKLNDRRHTARMESLRTSESNETKYNRRQRLPHVVATNRAFLGVSNAYRSIESPSGRNLFRRQQPAS
jgi:hypothetical protein